MAGTGNRGRILEALRLSAAPLDDDQLSERSQVRPRQQVNIICRALAQEGLLRRYTGPDLKIVNELVAADRTGGTATVEHDIHPGHSGEQRAAEVAMLAALSAQLGTTLAPAGISTVDGVRVEVDGADEGRTVLVECWAHQGPPKVAQKHKVLADALKLTWIASTIYPRPRLILCLSDTAAARPFVAPAKSWAAAALRDFGIAVIVVELPVELREKVVAAQRRQYR